MDKIVKTHDGLTIEVVDAGADERERYGADTMIVRVKEKSHWGSLLLSLPHAQVLLDGLRPGWVRCDYSNPDTLPPMDTVVELAVLNKGAKPAVMARAFGGRVYGDEGWFWAEAERWILCGGLPVNLDEMLEWDEDEVVYWRPLTELPPVPEVQP